MKSARRRGVNLEEMVVTSPESAYEALQLYKSKISRLRAKKAFNDAITESAMASAHMLKNGYDSAGEELSTIFTDILEESNQALTPTLRGLIEKITEQYPAGSIANINFLRDCIKWSVHTGDRLYGDILLQRQLGLCLWRANRRDVAVKHFVLAESPEALWNLLDNDYSSDISARDELFTIAILYFIAYENIRDAFTLLNSLKKYNTENSGAEVLCSKQVEFCDRLLQTCLRDAKPLFKRLVNSYLDHLKFDPIVESLIMGPIAKKMFGIESAPNLMSMIQSMLAGV